VFTFKFLCLLFISWIEPGCKTGLVTWVHDSINLFTNTTGIYISCETPDICNWCFSKYLMKTVIINSLPFLSKIDLTSLKHMFNCHSICFCFCKYCETFLAFSVFLRPAVSSVQIRNAKVAATANILITSHFSTASRRSVIISSFFPFLFPSRVCCKLKLRVPAKQLLSNWKLYSLMEIYVENNDDLPDMKRAL